MSDAPVVPEKAAETAPIAVEKAPESTGPAAPEKSSESDPAATETPESTTVAPEKSPEPIAAETTIDEAPVVAENNTDEQKPVVAEKSATSPLQELWTLAKANGHPEVWGVTLADPDTHIPSQIVFQKYLNANDGDLTKAKNQLAKTLEWRAKTKPLDLLKKNFSKEKFDGLGYVTAYPGDANAPETKEVFTWNIYGIVKSMKDTFGNLEEFIAWRAALMEMALQELSLSTATKPITAIEDPYKIFQVHDYKSLSFFRQDPVVKATSKETIYVFSQYYPELLKEKFFVNVPVIMGFMYGLMKLFVAPKTIKKFHPMSNGAALSHEFPDSKVEKLGEKLPAEYGGKGEELKVQGKATLLE